VCWAMMLGASLRCFAVCCNVMQYVEGSTSVLGDDARSIFQVCCSVLQHVALCGAVCFECIG